VELTLACIPYISAWIGSRAKAFLVFFIFLAIIGCRQAMIKALPNDRLVNEKLCHVKEQLRIGFYGGPNLVVIDTCDPDANHSVSMEKGISHSMNVYDYASDDSPNGKWTAVTSGNELMIRNKLTNNTRIVIRTSRFLTKPRWSPDSIFLFIGTAENTGMKRPGFQCVDDISEIYAVSAQSGNGSIVGRVCAGVPVNAFRWLIKP
jgi:hypothetical protein